MEFCLQLDNKRDLPGHRVAMLLFISLTEVELLLINAHVSYARAADLRTSHIHYFNITIRLLTCTTLTTSEPGEQSVPGAT